MSRAHKDSRSASAPTGRIGVPENDPKAPKSSREDRLAEQLRQNLRRRKQAKGEPTVGQPAAEDAAVGDSASGETAASVGEE